MHLWRIISGGALESIQLLCCVARDFLCLILLLSSHVSSLQKLIIHLLKWFASFVHCSSSQIIHEAVLPMYALFCFTERRLWDLLPPLEPEHGTHHLRWTPLCSRHQTEPSWNCCSSLYSTLCLHLDADVILSRAKDSLFRQQVHYPSLLLAWVHQSSQVHSTYLSHPIKI